MFCFQPIDNSEPTPKYYQIYKVIRDAFSEGKLKSDELLPSETNLMEVFNVSRVTIRKAIDKLETEGYVQKKPGYGTVVLDYRHVFRATRLSNLSSCLPGVKSVDIHFDIVIPSKKIQALLMLKDNEKVYRLTRTRIYDNVKIVYSLTYLIMKGSIKLTANMFKENTSLYAILDRFGVVMSGCDETIEARVPDSNIKRKLGLSESDVLFYRERVTFDDKKRPFEFDISYYNAAQIKYTISTGNYSHIIIQNKEKTE